MTRKQLARPTLLALILLSACVSGTSPHGTLATTPIPAGFAFKAIRPVQVAVSAAATLLPAGAYGSVELARPDGALLYKGPITSQSPLNVSVPLASKDSKLTARLVLAGGTKSITLDVAGDTAAHSFQ